MIIHSRVGSKARKVVKDLAPAPAPVVEPKKVPARKRKVVQPQIVESKEVEKEEIKGE